MSLLPIQAAPQLARWGIPAGLAAAKSVAGFAGQLGALLTPGSDKKPDDAGSGFTFPEASGSRAADRAALQKEVSSLLDSFHAQLQQALAEGGVSGAAGLQLRQDELGDLRVVGDHPRKAEIENLLAQNPQLTELFAAVRDASAMLPPAAGAAGAADVAGKTFTLHVGPTRTVSEFVTIG